MMKNIDKNQAQGALKIHASLLKRAVNNDSDALSTMFRQFIPQDEEIYYAQYLGRKGLLWIGTHSFACFTNKRVADISVGAFGEVIFQDGYLEFINSSVIYQPSKLGLYLLYGFWLFISFILSSSLYSALWWNWGAGSSLFISIILFGLMLLLTPFLVKSYYGIVKCGIVLWVREGVPVYIFSNRRYLKRANFLCRGVTTYREKRLKQIEWSP